MIAKLHRRVRAAALSGLVRQESGLAAVEFALILPILVMLWIGGVEVTQALSVDRRLNNLASAIGDLVARSKIVTWGDVDSIFQIAPGAMYPFSVTGLQMRVTAVNIDASKNAKVAWSRAKGTTTYPDNQAMNSVVPALLRVENTQVIVAEVFHTYKPTVGYVLTGNVPLNDRMFFVPRLVTKVQLCDNNKQNCKS